MSQDNKKSAQEETFYSKLGIPLASLKSARQAIEVNRTSGNVVCLVGAAGIGKTHIVRQAAADRAPIVPFKWRSQRWETSVPVKTLYLAHMQAEDIGVPYPSRAKRNALLRECDLFMRIAQMAQNGMGDRAKAHALELAKHVLDSGSALKDGTFEFLIEKNLKDLPPEGILFLDECNRADKPVLKAFFTMLEDREVHGCQLIPDGIQIVAAMNPSDGAYSVNEFEKDHAFRRRLSFVAVTVNTGAWLEHAEGRGKFHPYVTEFIKAMPSALYDTALCAAGQAFPSPATWEKVSTVIQNAIANGYDAHSEGVTLSVTGHIGLATASQFMDYIKDNDTVINPDEVLNKYTPNSDVRSKVLHLVKEGRNDILSELCTSVAITLFNKQTTPASVAPHLALYMGDLQPEMAISMITHKINAAVEGVDEGETYLSQLSAVMIEQPAWCELLARVNVANKKAKNEANSDPDNAENSTVQ